MSPLRWPCQDSNLGATGYEPAALPTELQGQAGATLAPPGRRSSGTLRTAMPIFADEATGQTLALLATFVGIGVLVNVVILYIVAQVLAERRQNQEYEERSS